MTDVVEVVRFFEALAEENRERCEEYYGEDDAQAKFTHGAAVAYEDAANHMKDVLLNEGFSHD